MIKASLKLIDTYLKRLKENNVYDNSAIIIMSDHGFDYTDPSENGRQNPTLLIKGMYETHSLNTSNIPVSYEDLIGIYNDLIDGKKTNEILKDIDPNRTRNYILYKYMDESHMEECTQKGDASDKNTVKKTGKIFER